METIDAPMEDVKNKQGEQAKLKVDVIVQTTILAVAAITLVADGFGIMVFYFGIGAYQLISSLVHLQYKNHSFGRKAYWPQLFIHILTFASLAVVEEPIQVLFLMLFTTGFTAIYYYVLTLVEYADSKRFKR
ncbi:MAG TPA: hypothetical protein VD905_20550 [Flavobacteriales bacterium]|nr:hypothetical protein [Flavobacteriales bacterium]